MNTIKNISKEELKEINLHKQARDLMELLDVKYSRKSNLSLDDYHLQFKFTECEDRLIIDILNKFYNI